MAFCDLFKKFMPIQVDEDIYLRQHEPKKDARPFWEIYYDEENFTYFGGYKNLTIGMKRDKFEQKQVV